MSCFNDNTVYVIINLFVLVMKKSIPVKRAFFKEKLPFFLIIPDCIRALESNKKIIIRNPTAIRPWQHVLEPLSGYLLLTEKIINNGILFSGAWNFGPSLSNIVSVEKLVTSLLDIWSCGDWTAENIGPINFHEANLLNLDISKAKFNLNWQPKWSLQQTLENTIEWYKHYNSYTSSEMRNLCISQIKQYCML